MGVCACVCVCVRVCVALWLLAVGHFYAVSCSLSFSCVKCILSNIVLFLLAACSAMFCDCGSSWTSSILCSTTLAVIAQRICVGPLLGLFLSDHRIMLRVRAYYLPTPPPQSPLPPIAASLRKLKVFLAKLKLPEIIVLSSGTVGRRLKLYFLGQWSLSSMFIIRDMFFKTPVFKGVLRSAATYIKLLETVVWCQHKTNNHINLVIRL